MVLTSGHVHADTATAGVGASLSPGALRVSITLLWAPAGTVLWHNGDIVLCGRRGHSPGAELGLGMLVNWVERGEGTMDKGVNGYGVIADTALAAPAHSSVVKSLLVQDGHSVAVGSEHSRFRPCLCLSLTSQARAHLRERQACRCGHSHCCSTSGPRDTPHQSCKGPSTSPRQPWGWGTLPLSLQGRTCATGLPPVGTHPWGTHPWALLHWAPCGSQTLR